ncbi:GntR family transcriptional regulator [Jatrophihabitans sp. GAS493]|uniref:FadR/GntR family transcriptional regulator n=1 Tax=Jatrophihabitans sp. GAS493 TaxID=1907575 RepID=UPI000BB8BBC7|nr:FCD domain-containing protein [Jatrophihabitans sp. GAS493]SOD72676.1 GntR family transcriptional regulator [Jatrophihabitans sp. GAS493]
MTSLESLWADSVYSPVPIRNAFEVTVERLARAIKLGVLSEGDRLPPERELALTLGVSRVTLREAIKALRDAGMVESTRGRGGGTFVVAHKSVTPRGVEQLDESMRTAIDDALDMRRVIEPGAAALAATRKLIDVDVATLQRCLAAAADHEPGSRRLADSRLHMAIAAAAGSQTLVAAVADVQLRLDRLLRAIPVLDVNIAHSDEQHAAIVSAIVNGEPDCARTYMEEHVDATAALLRGLL